jgi:M6 family metalloprotease-like protein
VFSWGPSRAGIVDVTAKTGVRIQGSPAAWIGARNQEQIAAVSSTGALMLFTRAPAADWTKTELSAGTGKTFAGALVGWTTPTDPLREHLAALSTDGALFLFERKGDDPFVAVDMTAKTGLDFSGLGGAWNVKGTLFTVEHLVALGKSDKKLYDLTSASLRNWTPAEIPMPAGHTATPDLTAWRSTPAGTENVALRTEANALVVVSRSGAGSGWQAFDLTAIDGEEVTGRPSANGTGDVFIRGKNNRALVFWRLDSPPGQLLDLTELTGAPLEGPPTAFYSDIFKMVAGTGPDQHLRVVSNFDGAQAFTERVAEPFETLRAQTGTRQTLTILWNPETTAANCDAVTGTNCRKPCASTEIGQGVNLKFQKQNAEDAMRRVSAYFRENSGGVLTVDNVATLGWYTSNKPMAHYAEAHGPGKCEDGWTDPGGGDVEKLAEALRQADKDFDFQSKDVNNDGTLSPDELAVIVMIPRESGGRGSVRTVVAENNAPLLVDGVKVSEVTVIDVKDGLPHLGTLARELSRTLFHHVDMSWGSPFPSPATALGALAVMDGTQAQGHHDGVSKVKLGWARAHILWHPDTYSLKDVETHHGVRVLLNPARGADEFFLFENRFRGGSFDQGLPADGLAIYHFIKNPETRQNTRPPFYVSAVDWSRIAANDWGHKAIQLVSPVSNRGYVSDGGASVPYSDSQSLWRQDTGYDLEPFPSSRGRAWLRWADGTPSTNPGVAIRNISAAGPEMSFTVALVPTFNPTFCKSVLNKDCDTVNDGLGGQVQCGGCTAPQSCGGGGVSNACGCTEVQCDGSCGEINRRCGPGFIDCIGHCPEGSSCYKDSRASFHYCRIPPEPCKCGGPPGRCFPCREDPLAPSPPPE